MEPESWQLGRQGSYSVYQPRDDRPKLGELRPDTEKPRWRLDSGTY